MSIVVGLDVGTSFIRAALGEIHDDGSVEILGTAQRPSVGLRNGVIVNIEAACKVIKETIEASEQSAGYEVTSCVTGIGGAQTESLNQGGSAAIASHGKGRREITQSDIDRAIEMATAVYIPLDREMLHIIPREYFVDNLSYGINPPVHTIGARLKAEVHIVTASKTAVMNIRSCINRAGYRLDNIMLKTLAATQTVMHEDEMELGSILIDMGAGTTDVLVLIHGAPVCSVSIAVGGNLVTNDIAIVKGIPTAEAEKIKTASGCCWFDGIEEDLQVILPGIGGRPPEETSTAELCRIIQPRVEEIFSMVRSAVVRKANLTQLSGNIILTGGGAQMRGVVELAQNVFGTTAVRIGIPEKLGGIEEDYRRADYATVIGLIESCKDLAAARDGKKKKRAQNAARPEQSENEGILKKIKNMFF
ncbi:cell division protein FtsA [Treponema parvum]|uniref:cell division protein FtsA n=1 Tax=Treponema parvum TaxID=138851 RepID=UPI002116A31C|nr:cell division protein FtsA [Treponema parvum]